MADVTGGRIKPGTIIGTDVSLSADIPAEAVRHTFTPTTDFGIDYASAPTSKTAWLYVFTGAGSVKGFHAVCADSGSSASITVDLQKNGSSILSAPITITNATGDGVVVDGTLSGVTTCVAGDKLTAVVVVSSSTGMQGLWAWATVQETSSPV